MIECHIKFNYSKTPTEKLKEFIESYPLNNDETWAIVDSLEAEEENYYKCHQEHSGNFYELLSTISWQRKR